jgi:microcystin degradation protein MlrC
VIRIGVGIVVLEGSSFNPSRFGVADIQARPLYYGPDVLTKGLTVDTALSGFLSLDDPEVEWAPLIACFAPGAILTAEAYAFVREALERSVRDAGHLDGCLLSMQGTMGADGPGLEDGDGDLLEALRRVLPSKARIGATLDQHCTVTPRMVRAADLLLAYQTFPPHWDKREIGLKIAGLLVRAVRGEIDPVTALVHPPMLLQPEHHDTRRAPMQDVLRMAQDAELIDGVLSVTMGAGFAWCDVPETGASVTVITDGAPTLAHDLALDLARRWFELRDRLVYPLVPIDRAVERALAASPEAPILLCDMADNPGSGGTGDAVSLLRALIDRRVPNAVFGVIADPAAVAACFEAGIGARVRLQLGEHVRPWGEPLAVEVYVKTLSDGKYRNTGPLWTGGQGQLGRAALVRVQEIDVILCERPNGAWDPAVYSTVGVDLRTKSVIVTKSQIFGREGLEPFVQDVLVVDSDGWGTTHYRRLPYQNVRRPIVPLDDDVAFGDPTVTLSLPHDRAVQASPTLAQ